MDHQEKAIEGIIQERKRQDGLWGEQNHIPEKWIGILGEEFGELCQAINSTIFGDKPDLGGYENMKKEATHLGAVAIGFLECLERNKDKWNLK